MKSTQNDTRKDSSRINSQASGREIIVGMVVGADIRHTDIRRRDAHSLQLQPTSFGQVDVPLLLPHRDGIHRITSRSKGIIHLVAHLEITA